MSADEAFSFLLALLAVSIIVILSDIYRAFWLKRGRKMENKMNESNNENTNEQLLKALEYAVAHGTGVILLPSDVASLLGMIDSLKTTDRDYGNGDKLHTKKR
jgi:hypothetical protein